jgi:hypothetical protein
LRWVDRALFIWLYRCCPRILSSFRKRQPCPWRIRKLRRDWHLEQAAAMAPPGVASKDSTGGRRLARLFSWSAAAERLVNAILVVSSELFQLSPQVDGVPE